MSHFSFLLFVVFKPIFASAKMCINPNAEVELKSPKLNLQLEVQNIGIEMTKPQVWPDTACTRGSDDDRWDNIYLCSPQYLSMVEVLESIDLMAKNAPYRKFRPDVPVQNNTKLWSVFVPQLMFYHCFNINALKVKQVGGLKSFLVEEDKQRFHGPVLCICMLID